MYENPLLLYQMKVVKTRWSALRIEAGCSEHHIACAMGRREINQSPHSPGRELWRQYARVPKSPTIEAYGSKWVFFWGEN